MDKQSAANNQKQTRPVDKPTADKAVHPLAETDPKVLSQLIRRILDEEKN